jgi:hypothetical protein
LEIEDTGAVGSAVAEGWGGEIVQVGPGTWRVWGRLYYSLGAARRGKIANAHTGKKRKRVAPRKLNELR